MEKNLNKDKIIRAYKDGNASRTEFNYEEIAEIIRILGLSKIGTNISLNNIDYNGKKYNLSLFTEKDESKLQINCSDGRNLCLSVVLKSYHACDGMSEWEQTYIDLGINCASLIKNNESLIFHIFIKSYSKDFNSYESLIDITSEIKNVFQETIEYQKNDEIISLDRYLYPDEIVYDNYHDKIIIGGKNSKISKIIFELAAKDLSILKINGMPVRNKKEKLDKQILEKVKRHLKIKDRCISIINESSFTIEEMHKIKELLLLEIIEQRKNNSTSDEIRKLVKSLSQKEQANILVKLLTQKKQINKTR